MLLNRTYPFLNVQIVENSVLGTPIFAVKLGKGPNKVFYSGGIHANEWITTVVLMKFIEDYCNAYDSNGLLYNQNIRELFNRSSIYIVPMVNPDGVDLVTGAIQSNTNIYENFRNIALNFPGISFPSGWKANYNGVDFKNYQPIYKVL